MSIVSKTKRFDPGDGGPPYRCGVMAMVFSRQGQVLACKRSNEKLKVWTENPWQIPQGGIDDGEDPQAAALRELWEEIGLDASKVQLLMQAPEATTYDFPDRGENLTPTGKSYRGQHHQWFAFLYTGDNIHTDVTFDKGDEVEFIAVEWWPIERLANEIVPFKRDAFRTAIEMFAPALAELKKSIAIPGNTGAAPKP
jgi:putative (di)nucleoside polyphosphate hydrolase